MGLDVDPLNTVQFSNHTGYPGWKGHRFGADHFNDIIQGLELNGLLYGRTGSVSDTLQKQGYSHVLSGYVGNAACLRTICELVTRLKKHSSSVIYVCDPVMGDDGKLYVQSEVVPIYRDLLLPIADVITPNQFEAEYFLTDARSL